VAAEHGGMIFPSYDLTYLASDFNEYLLGKNSGARRVVQGRASFPNRIALTLFSHEALIR
jgi:hypothetical protein